MIKGFRSFKRASVILALLLVAISLTDCSSSGPSAQNAKNQVGTFGYLSSVPTVLYTFPLSTNVYSPGWEPFAYQMYPPLYWFGGQGTGAPLFNASLSLAYPPKYSDGGRTVTIQMKHYKWSDGQPVTSRDVQFFLDLVKAEKVRWPVYVPGYFPDDVVSVQTRGKYEVVLHLSRSYGMHSNWFFYNELSQITPIPTHYWDKTSASSPIGNYDLTPSGAAAVWNYLQKQSNITQDYSTNPLWRVVDGPWKLQQFTSTGDVKFVPNKAYSGPVKPKLSKYEMIPFTSGTAELNYLLSTHNLTVASIPVLDVQAERARLKAEGYRIAAIQPWSINYVPINFHNSTLGPIVSQLYMRQAMESLIDQKTYIKKAFDGYGVPTYGPVPVKPSNPFASRQERSNPYPFDPGRAVSLLRSHGWQVVTGGVTTCRRAGTANTECGAGIPAGARLSFTLQYSSALPELYSELQFLAGDFEKAGIHLSLRGTDSLTYPQCATGSSACSWQMVQGGTSQTFYPDYYPTPDEIFACGAVGNAGSYCNPQVDRLVQAARLGGKGALDQLQGLLAKDLPALWLPVESNVVVYKADLRGIVPEDSLYQIYPATWHFAGS
jgi:peptide/nickel transport system substrate-binding protein